MLRSRAHRQPPGWVQHLYHFSGDRTRLFRTRTSPRLFGMTGLAVALGAGGHVMLARSGERLALMKNDAPARDENARFTDGRQSVPVYHSRARWPTPR